jgi:AsmA protein
VKIVKWTAGIVGGLLVLLVLGVVVLTLFIDPNRFRGRIETAVSQATGRPFQLHGDLAIAWFPWLAVQTGPAELGDLARWRSARLGVRLIPLIHGELNIDRIRFEGLSLTLHPGNWEDLLSSKSGGKSKAPRIAGLEIRDGALDFEDRNGRIRLSKWDLDVGAWGSAEPVPIETKLSLETSKLTVNLALRTRVELSAGFDRVALHDTESEGSARGVPFATRLPEVKVIFDPLEITIPEWSLKVAEAQLAGSLSAKKDSNVLRASGPLSARIPSVRKFLATLGIEAPVPKDATSLGPLSLKTAWAYTDGAIALKPIALQLDETAFVGELLRSNAAEPLWTFDLRGDHIDLGRYLLLEDRSQEPFELPIKTLKALRVQGTLRFDQARFADADMKNARLRVHTP